MIQMLLGQSPCFGLHWSRMLRTWVLMLDRLGLLHQLSKLLLGPNLLSPYGPNAVCLWYNFLSNSTARPLIPLMKGREESDLLWMIESAQALSYLQSCVYFTECLQWSNGSRTAGRIS